MLSRLLAVLFAAFVFGAPAHAGDAKIGTVDYGRAIQEIDEGKAAQARLDAMYAGEKAKIEQMEIDLQKLIEEYQSKQAILSDTARAEYEQRLGQKQMEYQQAYANADYEMQNAYFSAMEQLMGGLGVVAEEIGKEGSYDLILEVSQGSVLYSGGTDLTDQVIQRYNTKNP